MASMELETIERDVDGISQQGTSPTDQQHTASFRYLRIQYAVSYWYKYSTKVTVNVDLSSASSWTHL